MSFGERRGITKNVSVGLNINTVHTCNGFSTSGMKLNASFRLSRTALELETEQLTMTPSSSCV
jgi:hypothetical protein